MLLDACTVTGHPKMSIIRHIIMHNARSAKAPDDPTSLKTGFPMRQYPCRLNYGIIRELSGYVDATQKATKKYIAAWQLISLSVP